MFIRYLYIYIHIYVDIYTWQCCQGTDIFNKVDKNKCQVQCYAESKHAYRNKKGVIKTITLGENSKNKVYICTKKALHGATLTLICGLLCLLRFSASRLVQKNMLRRQLPPRNHQVDEPCVQIKSEDTS